MRRLLPLFLILVLSLLSWSLKAEEDPSQTLQKLMPEVRADLFELYHRQMALDSTNSEKIAQENKALLEALRQYEPRVSERRRAGISYTEAKELLAEMNRHPVVGMAAARRYDPKSQFGFCFGRAAWAHIELLRRGVSKDSIKKIYAVGPMRSGGIDWQFHVATLVRTTDGTWVSIDNVMREPLEAEKWMADIRKESKDGKLKFYVTEPSRLGASNTLKFSAPHFRDPRNDKAYNQYFEDMMKSFREVSKATSQARGPRKIACGKVFGTPAPTPLEAGVNPSQGGWFQRMLQGMSAMFNR